ncbi:MAG: rRNA maturation RNase YbeY [Verrucomicrobiota bacterium]
MPSQERSSLEEQVAIRFHIVNHHESFGLDAEHFGAVAAAAVSLSPLSGLPHEEIEVSFMSDEEISKVHAEFLGDSSPTDVITFDHGEILISVDTAARRCEDHGMSLGKECALYLVHGLLHLGGWEDKSPDGFARMKREQERILSLVWKEAAP